ncbi:hypothetical protein G9A89_010457 [Geosiphon pyriformis]|nr:hypothetical protein G9A89_010457 [Geosiphon pyriformis]
MANVKHGHRADWITPDDEDVVYPTGLNWDPPLSRHGCEQAKELAQYFVDNNIKIDRIFSSPYFRTLQTANAVAEALDIDICVEDGLSEWYGLHRIFIPSAAPISELELFFPRINTSHTSLVQHPSVSETIQDIHGRLSTTMRKLIALSDVDPKINTVLIVTHAASLIAGVRAVLEERYASIGSATCSLTELIRRNEKWVMLRNGDTSFMSSGQEKNWTFTEPNVTNDEIEIKGTLPATMEDEKGQIKKSTHLL